MQKSFRHIAILFAVISAPSVLRADITYGVNLTVGAGGITGTITTDGETSNPLATSDIVDWNLVISDGTNTFDLEGPLSGNNSTADVGGSDLTETSTQLSFDFSATDGGGFIIQNPYVSYPGPYACFINNSMAGDRSSCWEGNAIDVGVTPSEEQSPLYDSESGTQVIASVTPEPSTAILWLTGNVFMIVTRKPLAQFLRMDTGTQGSLSPRWAPTASSAERIDQLAAGFPPAKKQCFPQQIPLGWLVGKPDKWWASTALGRLRRYTGT